MYIDNLKLFLILCLGHIFLICPVFAYEVYPAYKTSQWQNLLHYHNGQSVINKSSDFFLAKDGYKNPKAEYIATLKAFSDDDVSEADNHAICKYPARFDYVLKVNGFKKTDFPNVKCLAYEEYEQKVPIDNVTMIFASENNVSPSSMMGHSFIKLSGKNENGLKEHSFSYFATVDVSSTLKFYADILTVGIDGAYVLSPYAKKRDEYMLKEKRSLWEFDLNLTAKEIAYLKKHLWELKGHNIKYSLISHNCNTAVISILKVAKHKFATDSIKPFVTPVEYVQELYNKELIKNISLEPTNYTKEKIKKYGVRNLLTANKSSRVEFGVRVSNLPYTEIRLSPIYQDIKDINTAYFDETESKIGEVALAYSHNKKRAYIKSFDILKMRSIIDYGISQDYSKYFKLSFENNMSDMKTKLKPVFEFGLGYGVYGKQLVGYFLPKVGFRYDDYANLYIASEIGAVVKLSNKIKVITSYEQYFNAKSNNRGYNARYNCFLGYELSPNLDLHAEYNRYSDAGIKNEFYLSVSYKF